MEKLQLTRSVKLTFMVWHGKCNNYEYTPSNQQYFNIYILVFTDIPTILNSFVLLYLFVECTVY